MMTLVELPVIFNVSSAEDLDNAERLGLPVPEDLETDSMYVNPQLISCMNQNSDKNRTTIWLSGVESVIIVDMKIDEVVALLSKHGVKIGQAEKV